MSENKALPKTAFTIVNPAFCREIITNSWCAVPSKDISKSKFSKYNALWDTGATNSVVTPKVVKELGLVPIGEGETLHAGGVSRVKVYLITLLLPNNVLIPNIRVSECADQAGRFDIIIGMDVITLGDFSISGQGIKRMLSFSMPSSFSVDYVHILNLMNQTE